VKPHPQLKKLLKDLFSSEPLAVLASQGNGQPYGNVVAFAATDDLKFLLFATARATRKYANITRDPRVALVMDDRTNQKVDFQKAIAVTATGIVEKVKGAEKNHLLKLYLLKHPDLKKFVTSPSCALLRVKVDTYYVVRRFQKVTALHMIK
jgi:nitroimidazol reductase NimA-like FMN-containing flavoprotein (pyridoxamine 5'-phosphate oxidase superfamily)